MKENVYEKKNGKVAKVVLAVAENVDHKVLYTTVPKCSAPRSVHFINRFPTLYYTHRFYELIPPFLSLNMGGILRLLRDAIKNASVHAKITHSSDFEKEKTVIFWYAFLNEKNISFLRRAEQRKGAIREVRFTFKIFSTEVGVSFFRFRYLKHRIVSTLVFLSGFT